MVFISVYVADGIEGEVDMGDLGVLVDGVGGFVALAQDSCDLVGGVDHIFHVVDIAGGEADDEVTDADTGALFQAFAVLVIWSAVCRMSPWLKPTMWFGVLDFWVM